MDRDLFVVLDHFEFRMLHAKALPAQPRFAEDDQPLPGRDHLLHVMQIEPAENQRLAERVRVRLLQCRLENFLPTAETDAAESSRPRRRANRRLAFVAGKSGKLACGPRSGAENGSADPRPSRSRAAATRVNFGPRDPLQLAQRLRELDHSIGDCGAQRLHVNLQARFAFVFVGAKTKGHVPRRLRKRRRSAIKKDRALKMILLPQAQNQMLLLENLRRDSRLDPAREKRRLQIAAAERFAAPGASGANRALSSEKVSS